MIRREATSYLKDLALQFKVIAVVGPRQSGKTTLVKEVFPEKPYINLELPDIRAFAQSDPRAFLEPYLLTGAILDEVQRVPDLFSYIQVFTDEQEKSGHFILSGSNNFLLQENITQSLAGRVAYLQLLPFSISEINATKLTLEEQLYKGFYPPLYDKEVKVDYFYANYVRTYIERDVRLLKNIENLATFERFLHLCAGRVGQLVNKSSLGLEAGIDHKTVESWLSILEASYIIFRLQPHHKNYNKRVVKMPKLYFYDVGLATSLLGIQQTDQLNLHPFKGALFENLVIVELLKSRWNNGERNNLYFWRNNRGNEIDVIVDNGLQLEPIEIKSGKTITEAYFTGIKYWKKLTGEQNGTVIYAGDQTQKRSNGITVLPYNKL